MSLKLGEKTVDLGNARDSFRLADPSQDAITFKIASTLAAHENRPLSDIADIELGAGLKVENDSKWKIGGRNVTFGSDASTEGAVVIRKQGELLRANSPQSLQASATVFRQVG